MMLGTFFHEGVKEVLHISGMLYHGTINVGPVFMYCASCLSAFVHIKMYVYVCIF